MTKPVTEPTPARESASYGYRIRQLERRPAPHTSSDLPYAYARYYDGGVIAMVPDSTYTPFADIAAAEMGASSDTTFFTIDLADFLISWITPTSYGFSGIAVARAHVYWSIADGLGPRTVAVTVQDRYLAVGGQMGGIGVNELTMEGPSFDDVGSNQDATMLFQLGSNEDASGGVSGYIYHEMGGDRGVLGMLIEIQLLSYPQTETVSP